MPFPGKIRSLLSEYRNFELVWGAMRLILRRMQVVFQTKKQIEAFRKKLPELLCPRCGAAHTLVRHGYRRRFRTPTDYRICAWRIRCKPRANGSGCGHTPSIRLGDCIPYRYFTSKQLWAFIRTLPKAPSIKAAWERIGSPLSLDTAYRLHRRLILCQSALRTALCARAPPPKIKAGTPLFQVFAHLKEVFGSRNPISAYQVAFQKSFLAMV